MTRVLLVEDDATLRGVLARELADVGFEVKACASAEEALEAAPPFGPGVALVDLKLPGRSGLDLLGDLAAALPEIQVVMLTGHGGVPEAVEAMRRGACDFLTKPTRLDVLEQVLRRAAERNELLAENARLRRAAASHDDPDAMLGESAAMRELRALAERIGPTSAPVLVLGEHGAGKELLARALHRMSPRRDQPWVVVNCGALPADLVESELFGHEKGSFTGADRRSVGLVEAAHRGTLFLDEIGDLPLAVQPVMLRTLQFGEVRPVGSTRTRTVDVRVIAATNRDLARDVREGRFREDLFFRLAAFQLSVPPLRARGADIRLLAARFLAQACARTGTVRRLDDDAIRALEAHAWPGNVRELENAMMRLAVLAPGEAVTAGDVRQLAIGTVSPGRPALPTLQVDELERLAVLAAIERHPGDKSAAAAALGVTVRTLYNKLKQYGLS
jgi:DNA-binding NtrC family response regulator